MKYDVDYFIAKFEAIPEYMWTMYCFEDHRGMCCANGHCGVRNNNYVSLENIDEAMVLADILLPLGGWNQYKTIISKLFGVTAEINDGFHPKYNQPTPKQRILAALYDIKKMQEQDNAGKGVAKPEPKPTPEQKIIHHYVSVPESITEQAMKLMEVQS